jgi:hypothetical protein
MPIRPEHVFLYPIDWVQLSHQIRFVRAGGRCEHCGRPHMQKVFHLGDGGWWDRSRQCWRIGRGRRVRRPIENILLQGRWTPVVLACALLNHDPSDSALHQLAALCQRCHMIHDGPEHRRRRWMNAHYRRALGDLFYGPYPCWEATGSPPLRSACSTTADRYMPTCDECCQASRVTTRRPQLQAKTSCCKSKDYSLHSLSGGCRGYHCSRAQQDHCQGTDNRAEGCAPGAWGQLWR